MRVTRKLAAAAGRLCLAASLFGCAKTSALRKFTAPPPGRPVEWVALKGGVFTLGSGEGGAATLPGVAVRDFELSKTEVTVEQYAECVAQGACTLPEAGAPEDGCNWGKAGRARHPVNCVSWEQASDFARFKGARLPSEAEWEYAARSGGRRRSYPWGDAGPACDSAAASAGPGCRAAATLPACSRPAGNTEQGLCDMAGNVWEWVQDRYRHGYERTPSDASAYDADDGFIPYRVMRGGSFSSREAEELRVDYRRRGGDPGYRLGDFGFRIARGSGGLPSYYRPLPEAPPAGAAAPPPAVEAVPPGPAAPRESQPIAWVRIQGGTFTLGTTDGYGDDLPLPGVRIRDFEMSRTEVTVGQYRACVEAGRCTEPKTPVRRDYCNWGKPGRERHPINCVDLEQALQFARFAGARLPSEAEWEYAARGGGRSRRFPWGDEEADCGRAVMFHGSFGCGTEATMAVCSKPAGNTESGLCDMAGNVWEWVADKYKNSYAGTPLDGTPYTQGRYQVTRGGSFSSELANRLRTDRRDLVDPGTRRCFLGFRLAR